MKKTANRLVYHLHDQALERAARLHIKGRLIDIGCGTKPYSDMMRPYVSEHVGVDHHDTQHANANPELWGSAYEVPAPDESFDSAG